MYLSIIKIKNFRIYKDLNLKLNKSMNILVGANNSGKTALIDAIRYTLSSSIEKIFIKENDFFEDTEEFSIELFFSDINDDVGSALIEHIDYDENKKPSLHLTLVANKNGRIIRGIPYTSKKIFSGDNPDNSWIEPYQDLLSVTYLKPLRDAENELSSGRNSRLSQILIKENNISNNKNDLIRCIEDANYAIENDLLLKNIQQSISKILSDIIFTTDENNISLSLINQGSETLKLQKILEKFSLDFISLNNGKQGLGYNNILFMATELILLKPEISDTLYNLLLIEEPEAHLHPQMQMQFIEFLKKHTTQSIISTHSPSFASKINIENFIYLNKGRAFSLRSDETKLDSSDYRYLEKFLDATKSNLFFAKGLLIVEGFSEEILLPVIAKTIGLPLEKHGISIINVGNIGLFRYSHIFQRRNKEEDLGIKIACITDKDKKDEDKIEEYQKKYQDKHIKLFISSFKTFEYDLLKTELNKDICTILGIGISDDIDKTYNEIKKIGKPEFALRLACLIENTYYGKINVDEIEKLYPPYLINAVKYVCNDNNE